MKASSDQREIERSEANTPEGDARDAASTRFAIGPARALSTESRVRRLK